MARLLTSKVGYWLMRGCPSLNNRIHIDAHFKNIRSNSPARNIALPKAPVEHVHWVLLTCLGYDNTSVGQDKHICQELELY